MQIFFNLATNEEKLQPISQSWPSIAATYPKSGFRVPVSPLLVIYVGVYRNIKSLSCSSNLTECLVLSWIFPKNYNLFHWKLLKEVAKIDLLIYLAHFSLFFNDIMLSLSLQNTILQIQILYLSSNIHHVMPNICLYQLRVGSWTSELHAAESEL